MSRKSFVGGAIILMLAGFVVRIFGFVYRVYLSNLIGAEGMGLFQLISPVYSLIILTLTSGISIAVSRMVAEEAAKRHPINLRRITACALAIVLSAGFLVSVLMVLNLRFISDTLLHDPRTYTSLLLLVPCIPVIAAASALKGYFYGIQKVVPTAVSQIVEQAVKISLVMLMAGYFINAGLEYACALATVGMAAGEIANLGVLVIVYLFKRRADLRGITRKGLLRKRGIILGLVKQSVPISTNRFIISIMGAVESILMPIMLVASGLDYKSSMEVYGRLLGMVMPLIFFPGLVTSSLATTLVPAISEAVSLKNFKTLNYRISKSIQITFILGFIFTAVFICYPNEIGNIVYRRERIGNILYMMAFTCVFIYLQQTLMGILNGLGKQGTLLLNTVIGYAIRIGFVYFLIPRYGIESYIWGIVVSLSLTSALNLFTIIRISGMVLDFRNWILKPGLVGVVMVLVGRYIYSFFGIFVKGDGWTIVFTLTGNVAIALFLMVLIGALKKDEVLQLAGIKGGKRK